jgi:uracil-DNA glycosylase
MPGKHDPDARPVPDSIQDCRRCDLWKNATQAVPGEGALHARIMLVGEQPGDEEDLQGRPFVGPAGRVHVIVALGATGLRAEGDGAEMLRAALIEDLKRARSQGASDA